MDIRPIRTADDHQAALREIQRLSGAAEGTPEFDTFDVLATLVEAYEEREYPMPNVSPVKILHYAITEMGHSQAELGALLGSRSRASEVLKQRRPLTLAMIDKIARAWHIPVATLAKPYPLAPVGTAGPKRAPAAKAAKKLAARIMAEKKLAARKHSR